MPNVNKTTLLQVLWRNQQPVDLKWQLIVVIKILKMLYSFKIVSSFLLEQLPSFCLLSFFYRCFLYHFQVIRHHGNPLTIHMQHWFRANATQLQKQSFQVSFTCRSKTLFLAIFRAKIEKKVFIFLKQTKLYKVQVSKSTELYKLK